MKIPESLKNINRQGLNLKNLEGFQAKFSALRIFIIAIVLFAALPACKQPQSSNAGGIDLTKFEITAVPGTELQRAVRVGEDGRLKEVGLLRNGKRDGAWVTYFDDKEVPQIVANFVKDKYYGVYMEYSKQGQITLLCNYENNQLEGKFARYRLGRTTEEGAYRKGKLHGNYKKYYDGKSIVQQEAIYADGELDGKTFFYDEQGGVIMQYTYKKGEKIEGGIVEKSKR